jgi:voltage-gated potassium channel
MPFDKETYVGDAEQHHDQSLKRRLFIIIFGTHTRLGKLFDVVLIILIALSVMTVMLESVSYITDTYGTFLLTLEWIITIFFSLEYMARVWVVRNSKTYIFSFYGIIDVLSILPTYLSLLIVGSQSLAILRAVRLLRIFRVLKLVQFVEEAAVLRRALSRSRHKITVFFLAVLVLVFIMGSLMYLVEGQDHGFNSIPRSVYWAIITLTTVGYGDIVPTTVAGQLIASLIMLLGYSIIAIPTGIVGSEFYAESSNVRIEKEKKCEHCGASAHFESANFCHNCGKALSKNPENKS